MLVDGVGCAMLEGVPEGSTLVGKGGYAMLEGVPKELTLVGGGGCVLVEGAADGPSLVDGVSCVLVEGSTFIHLKPRPRPCPPLRPRPRPHPGACAWGGLFVMLLDILCHTRTSILLIAFACCRTMAISFVS